VSDTARTAIVHYSSSPIVGGVEAVIAAHAREFVRDAFPVDVISGSGEQQALPKGVGFHCIPEIDSQNPEIERLSAELATGKIPAGYERMVNRIENALDPLLDGYRTVIFHNLFTKHFNLPLTAAVWNLIDREPHWKAIAWCHDISWTSAHSRPQLHPGAPWDLLRRYDPRVTYVTISAERRRDLAGLLGCPEEQIKVIYNGVDPDVLSGLTEEARRIVEAFGLLHSDLVLLMPVRVTQAKNIELACRVVAKIKGGVERVRLVVTGPPDPHDPHSIAYYRSLIALRDELGLVEEVRFVYELEGGLQIGLETVSGLYRLADLVLMPSHREGFGMPVLEAGLAGLPVFSTPIPASVEIGQNSVHLFREEISPGEIAGQILAWAAADPVHRLKAEVRRHYIWQAIFEEHIRPLLADVHHP
jgi:glycosyltransferase involved in cell wall biosynthesis